MWLLEQKRKRSERPKPKETNIFWLPADFTTILFTEHRAHRANFAPSKLPALILKTINKHQQMPALKYSLLHSV